MYTFESKVRYSEVNKDGEMSISSVINYLQDCAIFESESIGMGPGGLANMGKVWVLTGWQIEVERFPKYCEDILISTWPYEFKGMYGYRNFIVTDSEDQTLIKANSIWVLVDLSTGHPTKVTEDVGKSYRLDKKLDMDYGPRKISVTELGEPKESIPVKSHYIDTNHHVNNCRYVQMAMELIPENFNPQKVRVDYRKAAVLKDQIYPYVSNRDNGYIVSLCDNEKNPYAIVAFM